MKENTLVVVNGSTSLGAVCRMYFNVDPEKAVRRFKKEYPDTMPHFITFDFADEIHINHVPHGTTQPDDIYVIN